jgi:hypothetical protein
VPTGHFLLNKIIYLTVEGNLSLKARHIQSTKIFTVFFIYFLIKMGKKQTARDQLDDDFEIEQGQVYARSLGPRGNHQHEVEFIDGEKKLVTLPPRFRNVVWLKRGKNLQIKFS